MRMNNQKTFPLSVKEVEYLSKLMSEDRSFRNLLPLGSEFGNDQQSLTLDHDGTEQLRDYFSDRLVRVGFDENYEPNVEGIVLEKLMDMLSLPADKWPSR